MTIGPIDISKHAAKENISTIRFKYEGIFDYDGLYRMVQRWLTKKGYTFHEAKYKHKTVDLGDEEEMKWVATKKVTGYYANQITMEIHLWDINEMEIKGKNWAQARMEIVFNGTVYLDYEGNWGTIKVFTMLRDFYHKYVVKEQIENIWGEDLRLELLALVEDVKKFLSSYTTGKSY